MKSFNNNVLEINISVIGLSGGQGVKGTKGIGKSCICNRLAQPNHYKPRHNFVLESTDSYGFEISDSQWLFWGSVNREIRGRHCQFRLIEHTVMVENLSKSNVINSEKYVECAVSSSFYRATRAHIVGPIEYLLTPLKDKTYVNLFLLLYDVSLVEGRDPNIQDLIFKQLFDKVIATSLPVIIVSTKHDIASPCIVNRLSDILQRSPYCEYPFVETSASLNVNINIIFDLAVILCQDSSLEIIHQPLSFQNALLQHNSQQEQNHTELRQAALLILSNQNWQRPWTELGLMMPVKLWVDKLGGNIVMGIFEEVRSMLRLERRNANLVRYRDGLCQLLNQYFGTKCPSENGNVGTMMDRLINDPLFMSHFIEFDEDAEYFDFGEKADLLPHHIVDETKENNMLHVIKEYLEQRILEDQLFTQLKLDGQGYFTKSLAEVREELLDYVKVSVDEGIVRNAYERFQKYFIAKLEILFLEAIHENLALFLAKKIFNSSSVISVTQRDGTSRRDIFHSCVITEINRNISFVALPLSDDVGKLRENWIRTYLTFLTNRDESECIFEKVTHCTCDNVRVNKFLGEVGLGVSSTMTLDPDRYIVILTGDSPMRNQLSQLIHASINSKSSDECTMPRVRYDIKVLDCVEELKNTFKDLVDKDTVCCGAGVLLCAREDTQHSIDVKSTLSELEDNLGFGLAKYIVYSVSDDVIKVGQLEKGSSNHIQPESEAFHAITLLSRLRGPSVIWVVTVCGDNYDYGALVPLIIKSLQKNSSPRRKNDVHLSLIGCFTCAGIDKHFYQLSFVTYHQVIKTLIGGPMASTQLIDGLILVCSLDRPASINTCLGIKRHLPSELQSSCHFMLLGVESDQPSMSEYTQVEAEKLRMRYVSIASAAPDGLPQDPNNVENQLVEYFMEVFKGPPVTMSIGSGSLVSLTTETTPSESCRTPSQLLCQKCEQRRSNDNVYNYFLKSDAVRDLPVGPESYEPVLGTTNYGLFDEGYHEYRFDTVQDICEKCMKIKCNTHVNNEEEPSIFAQPFRTRVRSKSGPDLRSFFHSNKTVQSRDSNTPGTHCALCGAKLPRVNSAYNSKKSLFTKPPLDKSSPSRKFCTIFQDLFSPIRRLNDIQPHDLRKTLIRSCSKRHK